jgi:hypothetical protein
MKPKHLRGKNKEEAIELFNGNKEEFEEFIEESEMQLCDDCKTYSFSDEVRWKGYDFEYIREDKADIECLCDDCIEYQDNHLVEFI